MSAPSFTYISYSDNWSFYDPSHPNQYPTIPAGVLGATAFAVINNDGNVDVRYPLAPSKVSWAQGSNPAAGYALAVGGWNNSNLDPRGAENMGLYNVLTNNQGSYIDPKTGLTGPQRLLINSLFVATLPQGASWEDADLPFPGGGDPQLSPQIRTGLGYKCLIIDFENFANLPGQIQNPQMFNMIMKTICQKIPNAVVHMAIPGYMQHDGFMDLDDLMKNTNIQQQLMLYDYASGLTPVPGSNPPVYVVSPNASVQMTHDALQPYAAKYPTQMNRFLIGYPSYGRGFIVSPGLTVEAVQQGIAAKTLTGSYLQNKGDSIVSDDDLLTWIGDWDTPTNGWSLITVKNGDYNDYYYYESSSGKIISAFPNGQVADSVGDFADMVQKFSAQYGNVAGFMTWEAQQDFNGTVITSLMHKVSAAFQRMMDEREWVVVEQPSESASAARPIQTTKQTSYLDIMAMDGNVTAQDLQSILTQLQAAGVNQVNFSFTQINAANWEIPGNTTDNPPVSIFQKTIELAHQMGMKVALSFGGANATVADWEIADSAAQANALIAFAQTNKIDQLDFDYEIGSVANPDKLLAFFQNLHSGLSSAVPLSLTVMASPSNSIGYKVTWPTTQWTGGSIANLFQNFTSCFDDLNLMMYGGPEYLDPPSEYLEQWIGNKQGEASVAKQCNIPLKNVHIGFIDFTPYQGTQDGKAIADIYAADLATLGFQTSDFGDVFWWPTESGAQASRYRDEGGRVDFQTGEMAAFNEEEAGVLV
jgi:GH18 family chitinase